MKRTWIGAGLLALLLAAGLLAGGIMERRLGPGAEDLRLAGDAAMDGDWDRAAALTSEVRTQWDRLSWLTKALSTHADLEHIEAAFAQLAPYAAAGDPAAYSALCAALAEELEAVAQAHCCNPGNFF